MAGLDRSLDWRDWRSAAAGATCPGRSPLHRQPPTFRAMPAASEARFALSPPSVASAPHFSPWGYVTSLRGLGTLKGNPRESETGSASERSLVALGRGGLRRNGKALS